jgi:hypothetical protein
MDQPVDRVSHVVLRFEPDHLDDVKGFFEALGVTTFELVDDPELGLRVWVSFEAGVELIAPAYAGGRAYDAVRAELDRHGEGFHSLVFGVADLDAAAAAAASVGVPVTRRSSFTGSARWAERFRRLDEAMLEPLHGVPVVLGCLEPQIAGRR